MWVQVEIFLQTLAKTTRLPTRHKAVLEEWPVSVQCVYKPAKIPLDLEKSMKKKLLKVLFKSLGSNLNEHSAAQTACTLDAVGLILHWVEVCKFSRKASYRSVPKKDEAVHLTLILKLVLVTYKTLHLVPKGSETIKW